MNYRNLPPLDVLISEEALQARIQEMAAEINRTYAHTERLVIIAVLKGAVMFLSDLVRYIDVPCEIEFVRLSSYGNEQKSSGKIKPMDLSLPDLANQDVLIIEDIVDTGLTLNFFRDYLESLQHTKSIRLAVLLDKAEARSHPVQVDFVGFEIGNEFVIGYGLDLAGLYRNLPFIGVVRES